MEVEGSRAQAADVAMRHRLLTDALVIGVFSLERLWADVWSLCVCIVVRLLLIVVLVK